MSARANDPEPALRSITSQQLASQPQPGRYLLDAYVIELQPCPVCEPPLHCKPCLSDHILVADEPKPPEGSDTAMLRVTADQVRDLVAASRYRFEVQVHPAVGGGTGINYMEVLKYDGPLDLPCQHCGEGARRHDRMSLGARGARRVPVTSQVRTPALPCQHGGGRVTSLDTSAFGSTQFRRGYLGGVGAADRQLRLPLAFRGGSFWVGVAPRPR